MPRFMVPVSVLALALTGSPALSWGAAAQEATPDASPTAMQVVDVELRTADGEDAGLATFAETPGGAVSIGVAVTGLEPGDHGIHVHETGICDATGDEPFSSAGGHYNPTGDAHGGPSGAAGSVPLGTPEGAATPGIATPGHAGDLGNIVGPNEGAAAYSIVTDRFTLSEGATSLQDEDGSALIIHADRDDLTTDPGGNSGDRIICGVIYPPAN